MYIGNTVITQGFTPQVDFFSGNASTTAFTLSRPVASTYQMIVVVANVTQNPGSAYTVNGNTITFASAPPSGTNNIWVEYTSLITQTIVPTNSYQVSGPVYTGTSSPLGGATNPITGSTGSANNYIQTYIYNTFNGANSSADFTAYSSNGTDASGWADMGITSPSFSQSAYSVTGPNEPYLFGSAPSGSGTSGNLVIATDSTGTTNAIQFYTGGFTKAKSAFAMMIDQNSNVGVGVTPSAWGVGKALEINYKGCGLWNAAGATDIQVIANNYYNGSNYVYASNGYATKYYQDSGVHAWLVAPSGTAGATISFTQAMTLANNGQLLVNTTSSILSSAVAQFIGNSTYVNTVAVQANNTNTAIAYTNISGTASYSAAQFCNSGTSFTSQGSITVNASSTAYNTSSDRRLKSNIATFTNSGAIIDALQPRTFTWNLDNSADVGFIADEFQQVLPRAVTGQPNAVDAEGKPIYQQIDASQPELIAYLVAEIQSLRARLKAANIA